MKLQLVHIDNYLIVVDDSEPKIGDIVLEEYVDGTKGMEQIDTLNDIDVLLQKRITHHLPLNNAPVLEGIELLPPLDIDLYSYATEEHKFNHKSVQEIGFVLGVKIGYNKAKEDYKYTEEDLRIAIQQAFLSGVERLEDFEKVEKMIIENIQGLQPKLPTSFDTETKQYIYATHN